MRSSVCRSTGSSTWWPRRIEVYRDPSEGAFLTKRIFERGESTALLRFPDVMVAVSSVMK
jgi:hypothetical protein